MKRIDQKVKDIVEVRSSSSLSDFLVDPANTLAGYHFTDITSDLMAKWIDRIAGVRKGHGVATALAGFRGVGKSHFLATLGAIVAQPELRSAISDQHVAASAQRLSRRHGVVAYVKRGSRDTLLEELKDAVSEISAAGNGELGDSISELMAISAAKSGDLPPVIVVDTAFGRETRVARDDGLLLSEIAAAAKEQGIFVGIALDDDIAGADGINSSIASSFEIDYLDQEHLYKIVNAHVFAKNEQMHHVLHDIYESYRASMPGFKWSEGRFSSLYPLHPAILEIAPFVRLYLQDFALLGFASEAGVKILGRPANSLIGLDEVFDSVEDRLRNVADLKDAFDAYDSLEKAVVAKAPVMQRHEAKLVLKGLFLLSLTGDAWRASDLAASMLIFNGSDPEAAISNVEGVLRAFATALPASVKISGSAADAKYALISGSSDDINAELTNAIATVPADVVWPILRRQTAEKFVDLSPSEHDPSVSTKCTVIWRGGLRRGEIVWTEGAADEVTAADWRVFVRPQVVGEASEGKDCEWRLGELTADDIDTLRRFHVLQTDTAFREKFRDSIANVLHMHLIAVEKIWQRVFLENGYLIANKIEYRFSDSARAAHTLAQLFTITLADHFAALYPEHPEFDVVLEEQHASHLIENFFGGAAPDQQDIQELAARFAAPLGLVVDIDAVLSPIAAADLVELGPIKTMLAEAPAGRNGLIAIGDLSSRLSGMPFGLTREAEHLVLAALVAQRQFEFVTASGNRINYRSLDLQIVWDDIIGLAPPSAEAYSGERLLQWAIVLTGDAALKPFTTKDARARASEALSAWFVQWQGEAVVERFDKLSDDKLNTRLWRLGTSLKKTFGVAADAVSRFLENSLALDECLQAVANAFSDQLAEFEARNRDLAEMRNFLSADSERDHIKEYLLFAEPTNDRAIDTLRDDLLTSLTRPFDGGVEMDDAFRENLAAFKDRYSDWYSDRHDAVMHSVDGQLDEFLASSRWWIFGELSAMAWFGSRDLEDAMRSVREIRSLRCKATVRDVLTREPCCVCAFDAASARTADLLVSELRLMVDRSLARFRELLLIQAETLKGEKGRSLAELAGLLEGGNGLAPLSALHIQTLRAVAAELALAEPNRGDRRRSERPTAVGLHPDDIRQVEDQVNLLGPN